MKRPTVTTKMGHPQRSDGFSWDELRYFLEVCELGSFRAAAEKMGVSPALVRRKIETLEAELSTVLFTRSASGAVVTPDGRSVYSVSIEVRQQIGYLDNFAMRRASSAEGLVKLTVTEGLGSFWLTPQIERFVEKFPRIRLDLRCEMRVPDLSRLETDIAVQLDKPSDESLDCEKIATLHFAVFGNKEYLDKYGYPKEPNDLINHRFVHLVADQVPHYILKDRVKADPYLKFARVITNTSSSHALAVAEGAGLGLLPSYAAALSHRLIPTGMNFYLKRSIWLVTNPESNRLKRVTSVMDWVRQSFDSKKYPWFRDEFIPPSDFSEEVKNNPVFMRKSGRLHSA